MGVWIETESYGDITTTNFVTPFVGVWIETLQEANVRKANAGHTLRGCVD